MAKKTKKITRKGCRNVQLVWHDYGDSDGEWLVEKIHPTKPATFITKREEFVTNALSGTTVSHFKKFTKFPISWFRHL